MTRNNPSTSTEAYHSLVPAEMQEIYRLILSALSVLNEATFEEIAAHMRVDKSRVWKRLSELDRMELIYRPGNKRPLKSGRSGFTWMLRNSATPKTDHETNQFKKGTQASTDYANKLIESSNPKYVQIELL